MSTPLRFNPNHSQPAEDERTAAARHQVYLNGVAVLAQLRGARRRRMRERVLVVLAVLWLILAYTVWP